MMDRVRRTGNARDNAEAAFKSVTAKPAAPAAPKAPLPIPGGREMVSLRIDREVLERFQSGGPGWQDRINEALKAAVAAEPVSAEAAS